jgi:ribosomal protein S30
MTTPRVTEMPVQPDPFIEAKSRSSAVRPRLTEREERERRVELVRSVMRAHAGDGPAREDIRNGWPARPT